MINTISTYYDTFANKIDDYITKIEALWDAISQTEAANASAKAELEKKLAAAKARNVDLNNQISNIDNTTNLQKGTTYGPAEKPSYLKNIPTQPKYQVGDIITFGTGHGSARGQDSKGNYYSAMSSLSSLDTTNKYRIKSSLPWNSAPKSLNDPFIYLLEPVGSKYSSKILERYWNSGYFQDKNNVSTGPLSPNAGGGYKYDTGGYTGEWGPEGRWAMLHQKEIVLNKHDTENFLTAIDILRGMQDNLLSTQMQQALQKFSSHITSSLNNTSNNNTTQNIYVTAEFPNATNHNEIEQAFQNLANDFSQRINRV